MNDVSQAFHSIDLNKISVFDWKSDLSLYDTEKNTLIPIFETANELETYPNWSPDGKFLYYTSSIVPEMLKKIENAEFNDDTLKFFTALNFRYNLMRIPFNADTRRFGKPELMIDAAKDGKSITFPRISPDGRYILYCLTNDDCFSVWHRESDLYLYDLQTSTARELTEINSTSSESYHNWTEDGTWMVFTSRRDDGSYTRLYFSHFQDGKFSKPFILPQREPEENAALFFSYNVPELLNEPVPFTQRKLVNIINSPSKSAVYSSK
jgi:dipeptidyl aminopeptidase/acylaminoacyl peptidase